MWAEHVQGIFKDFAKFTGKIFAKVSFLIELQAKTCNIIKKQTLAQCFPVSFAKFLRAPCLQNTS